MKITEVKYQRCFHINAGEFEIIGCKSIIEDGDNPEDAIQEIKTWTANQSEKYGIHTKTGQELDEIAKKHNIIRSKDIEPDSDLRTRILDKINKNLPF